MAARKASSPGAVSTATVPKNIQLATLLAIVVGLLFVKPFFGTILFSALIAFIFNPVYKGVLKKTKKSGLAFTATIIAALLSFVVPLVIVAGATINQVNTLVTKFQAENVSLGPAQVNKFLDQSAEHINDVIKAAPGGSQLKVDREELKSKFKDAAGAFASGLVDFIKSTGGAVFGLISASILTLFLIAAMLSRQKELVSFIRTASPFQDAITDRYLNRAGAMTKAMVKGQLIIAVVQGLASAFSLWIVGVDYFWFFFVLLTFLSFIPLGGGILTIPIGIVIMLTGNVARGLFVILWHVLVVSNIDNILRPKLVPKEARLNPALVLLAVFSGIAFFGPAGVIYGPVLMIILTTTLEMYAEYSKEAIKS